MNKSSYFLVSAVDLEGAHERAERARVLFARVFGSTSVADLVKSSFVEQAESPAAILRLIDEQGLREELEDIVGSQLMRTLDACQVEYEDMVDERLRRRQGMAQDHRQLLGQLRWNLVAYVNAVQSLYRPSKPETGGFRGSLRSRFGASGVVIAHWALRSGSGQRRVSLAGPRLSATASAPATSSWSSPPRRAFGPAPRPATRTPAPSSSRS
jgi:hypothetical protein